MLFSKTKLDCKQLWMYMERYVNKGSPSGFGGLNEKYNVSTEYNPFGEKISFPVYTMQTQDCKPLGDRMLLPRNSEIPNYFYIHPDMLKDKPDLKKLVPITKSDFLVTPSSSSRTVYANNDIFIKLHCDRLIGRVDRKIKYSQAVSSVELTQVLIKAVEMKLLPNSFYFLLEPFAYSVRLDDGYEMSCVFRNAKPHPNNPNIKWIIPVFSLFSKDCHNPAEPFILKQLIDASSLSPTRFIIDKVCLPIIDNYFNLILYCGLQFECQAQNMLLALDESLDVIGVIFRDLESVDKDVQLICDRKLTIYECAEKENVFKSYPYKCIWEGYRPHPHPSNSYQIKHSFMYDFKLGEYVFKELVDLGYSEYNLSRGELNAEIRYLSQKYIKLLPNEFFPKDRWYSYGNEVLDRNEDSKGIPKPKPFKESFDLKYRQI